MGGRGKYIAAWLKHHFQVGRCCQQHLGLDPQARSWFWSFLFRKLRAAPEDLEGMLFGVGLACFFVFALSVISATVYLIDLYLIFSENRADMQFSDYVE